MFLDYLNTRHRNLKFTVKIEHESSLPFLDILVERIGTNFVTKLFHKKTFTGLYSKYDRFSPH